MEENKRDFWTTFTRVFEMKFRLFSERFWLFIFLNAAFISLSPFVSAQRGNVIVNGGFEEAVGDFENLYDGVNSLGEIEVFVAKGPVFLEGAKQTLIGFPAAPCLEDVNGDSLPDLVVAGSLGNLYWFPNSGKKGEPKFTHAKLVQTYLGTAAKIDVADYNNDGKKDILFGNIEGSINVLLNQGSPEQMWIEASGKPRWMPPSYQNDEKRELEPQTGYEVAKIQGGKEPLTIGVYSAPVYEDWNKDKVPDLIVGEGSYSANSVHIWINQGNATAPIFNAESRMYLGYGEGREVLSPSVFDWNRDGVMDLLVGDREGRIALHLGSEKLYKDPKNVQPVPFTKFLKLGAQDRVTSPIAIQACDYNEDGIPDILYGNQDGKIFVSLGKGKKDDPELSAPTVLKGVDTAKNYKQPDTWTFVKSSKGYKPQKLPHNMWVNDYYRQAAEAGTPYTGTAPIAEVVSKTIFPEVREGNSALRLTWYEKFCGWQKLWYRKTSLNPVGLPAGFPEAYMEGVYSLMKGFDFVRGKEYELSFWKKGAEMKMFYMIDYTEVIKVGGKNDFERHHFTDSAPLTSEWSQYKKVLKLAGTKNKDTDTNGQLLKDEAQLIFTFVGKGNGWLDDVRLVEAGAVKP
jgi:hypothetical protein